MMNCYILHTDNNSYSCIPKLQPSLIVSLKFLRSITYQYSQEDLFVVQTSNVEMATRLLKNLVHCVGQLCMNAGMQAEKFKLPIHFNLIRVRGPLTQLD